jgi:hypothetical protein
VIYVTGSASTAPNRESKYCSTFSSRGWEKWIVKNSMGELVEVMWGFCSNDQKKFGYGVFWTVLIPGTNYACGVIITE